MGLREIGVGDGVEQDAFIVEGRFDGGCRHRSLLGLRPHAA
jgi:hypothetical protein